MGNTIEFVFRNERRRCITYIDTADIPNYVFIELLDPELIKEFGEEVTVKTDFENRLPKQDDYKELVALRQAIFDAVKNETNFIAVRTRMRSATGDRFRFFSNVTGQQPISTQ